MLRQGRLCPAGLAWLASRPLLAEPELLGGSRARGVEAGKSEGTVYPSKSKSKSEAEVLSFSNLLGHPLVAPGEQKRTKRSRGKRHRRAPSNDENYEATQLSPVEKLRSRDTAAAVSFNDRSPASARRPLTRLKELISSHTTSIRLATLSHSRSSYLTPVRCALELRRGGRMALFKSASAFLNGWG